MRRTACPRPQGCGEGGLVSRYPGEPCRDQTRHKKHREHNIQRGQVVRDFPRNFLTLFIPQPDRRPVWLSSSWSLTFLVPEHLDLSQRRREGRKLSGALSGGGTGAEEPGIGGQGLTLPSTEPTGWGLWASVGIEIRAEAQMTQQVRIREVDEEGPVLTWAHLSPAAPKP